MRSNPQQDIGEDVKGVLSLQGDYLRYQVCLLVGEAHLHDGFDINNDYDREIMMDLYRIPDYSTSLDAIRPVWDKAVEDLGSRVCLAALAWVAVPEIRLIVCDLSALIEDYEVADWLVPITVAHALTSATPEQICKAILLAYAEKEKKG